MQEDVLMTRIALGDEDSFAQLYHLWCKRVMAYAYRSLHRDFHAAQDVVQETFIQVYKAAPGYRAEGKFGAFVFKIAHNLINRHFQRNRPMDSLSEMLDDESAPHPQSLWYSPEEGVIDGIDIGRLIDSLPPRQKEALLLVANGISYAEGAEMFGITTDAFAHLVWRAKHTLKQKFGKGA